MEERVPEAPVTLKRSSTLTELAGRSSWASCDSDTIGSVIVLRVTRLVEGSLLRLGNREMDFSAL